MRWLALVAVAAGMTLGLAPASADGATLTVTKAADSADGTCNAADCSLREAIIAANASVGNDRIVLPARTYELSIAGLDENAAATGDLDVSELGGEVLIAGAGQATTRIDANGIDRVFDVLDDGELELRDLTVTGGDPRAAALLDDRHGGGIRSVDGRIRLLRVTFAGNVAHHGGAIQSSGTGNPRVIADLSSFVDNDALGTDGDSGSGGAVYNDDSAGINDSDGQLIATATRFESNSAGGPSGDGGAVYSADTGHVSLIDSQLIDNDAPDRGGAVYNEDFSLLAIVDSVLTGSSSGGDGGALFNQNEGGAGIVGTTISDSDSGDEGGAIFNQNHGHLTIGNSTIQNSTAVGGGGSMYIHNDSTTDISGSLIRDGESELGGGAIYLDNSAVLTLTDSTVSDSEALADAGTGEGGGGLLVDDSATFTAVRSTISGNTSAKDGGGIEMIPSEDSNVLLVNSTLSGNTAAGVGGGLHVSDEGAAVIELSTIAGNSSGSGAGGGIANDGVGSSVEISRSLLSGNTAPGTDNCTGPIVSGGFNLETGTDCGFAAGGDLQSAGADLGPLAANGGPTATHALGSLSAAIDAAGACGRPTDQRGTTRPQGSACDIGSFERAAPPPDTTAPTTTIDEKPKKKLKTKRKKKKVTFEFSSSEAGSTFECALEGGKASLEEFAPCTSPYKIKLKSKRKKGAKYRFSVRAIDAAGNVDPTPEVAKVTVKRKGGKKKKGKG